VDTTRTPVPSCRPDGNCVCEEVEPPGWRTCWYSRSSKLARSRLKPVVLVFARLLETTDMRICCASSPVLATQRAWFMAWFLTVEGGESRDAVPRLLSGKSCAETGVVVLARGCGTIRDLDQGPGREVPESRRGGL